LPDHPFLINACKIGQYVVYIYHLLLYTQNSIFVFVLFSNSVRLHPEQFCTPRLPAASLSQFSKLGLNSSILTLVLTVSTNSKLFSKTPLLTGLPVMGLNGSGAVSLYTTTSLHRYGRTVKK
jgi:hypothetical protein